MQDTIAGRNVVFGRAGVFQTVPAGLGGFYIRRAADGKYLKARDRGPRSSPASERCCADFLRFVMAVCLVDWSDAPESSFELWQNRNRIITRHRDCIFHARNAQAFAGDRDDFPDSAETEGGIGFFDALSFADGHLI